MSNKISARDQIHWLVYRQDFFGYLDRLIEAHDKLKEAVANQDILPPNLSHARTQVEFLLHHENFSGNLKRLLDECYAQEKPLDAHG